MSIDYRQSHLEPDKARSYDLSFSDLPYRKMVWDWEKEILDIVVTKYFIEKESLKYLDFACGTGRILGYLEHYMDESYGVDISDSMLTVAKENTKQSRLIYSDLVRDNTFSNGYFDIITAFRFFLNAQQGLRYEILTKLRRIIKDDGYLIFNIHMNQGCLLEKEITIYQWIKGIKDLEFNFLGIRETKSLITKSDFKIVEMYHFGVIPIYSDSHKFFLKSINAFERTLSQLRFMQPISQYIIYVCRPAKI